MHFWVSHWSLGAYNTIQRYASDTPAGLFETVLSVNVMNGFIVAFGWV